MKIYLMQRHRNTYQTTSIRDRVKLGLYDTWLEKDKVTKKQSFFIHKREQRGVSDTSYTQMLSRKGVDRLLKQI
jgi:hypothetical protein